MSKMKEAMKYVDEGVNPHAAAVMAGIAPTHVYRAIKVKRAKEQGICPSCGRTVKDLSDLQLLHERVLQQLDYTAQNSQSVEKREICRSIALALRGG